VTEEKTESKPETKPASKPENKENPFMMVMRKLDHLQRSRAFSAFGFGVIKKYGDDNGGSLAALLTYYGFLSVFPLLLVLVTVLGLIAAPGSGLESRLLGSALTQFPVIGNELQSNIKTLHDHSPASLAVGIVGLIWGSTGVSQSAQFAMAQVWNIPKVERPGFFPRLGRSGEILAVGVVFLVLSSFLAGVATFSGKQGVLFRIGGGLLCAIADVALFLIVFRILTPKMIGWGDLVRGAVAGGVVWAILQSVGVFLMDHELRHMSQVYGFFAIVLGTLWWIYLAAEVLIYSAEFNVVRARRLWPRSLVQPPLTPADMKALDFYAHVEQRRPEVSVITRDSTGATESA
jgi:YihY family inner membrane protein